MHGDGRNGGIGRLPIVHAVGHARRQHVWHGQILRVKCTFGSRTSDPVPDPKPGIALVHRYHSACGAIAERCWGFQTITHLLKRALPSQRACRLQHFAHLIGARSSFLQQIHPRLLHLHPLSADAYD